MFSLSNVFKVLKVGLWFRHCVDNGECNVKSPNQSQRVIRVDWHLQAFQLPIPTRTSPGFRTTKA